MKDLSPLAKQLVKVGQRDLDPTGQDKARIRELLAARLPAALPTATGPSASVSKATSTSFSWPLVSALTIGGGAVVGILYWSLASDTELGNPAPTPTHASAAPGAVTHEVAPWGSASDVVLDPTPVLRPAASADSPVPAEGNAGSLSTSSPPASTEPEAPTQDKTRSSTRLGEEVELLSRATSALHSGQANEALSVLAEHQRKFPRGALSLERRAARVQALCLLGRRTEAERELQHLPPSSPLASRARASCAKER